MPFDYMHSNVPKSYADAGEKAEAQYVAELEDRAAMLHRLGYGEEETVKRLVGNIRWDWECNPKPGFVEGLEKSVVGLVRKVYSKPPAPEKGRRVTAKDLKTLPTD